MYKRVLLAYDGSMEGRVALREGALLARQSGAKLYLLAVIPDSPGLRLVEDAHAGVVAGQQDAYQRVFEEGLARAKELGFSPTAKLVRGEPAQEIGAFAKRVEADLVVVGHRRQSLLERWWSGSSRAYLVDHLGCSLLIARTAISDAAFEAEVQRLAVLGA